MEYVWGVNFYYLHLSFIIELFIIMNYLVLSICNLVRESERLRWSHTM